MRYNDLNFRTTEAEDILIAVLTLTFAFTIANFSHNSFHETIFGGLYILLVSFIAVLTAFLSHELAHRQVARKFGGYSEFRIWPMGLLGSIFMSFFGFVAAAPGAVNISGIYGNERIGKTAMAGPGTNIVLGTVFMVIAIITFFIPHVSSFFISLSQINLYLATFNLIPFGPLDGYKVLTWDFRTFAVVFSLSIFLSVLSFAIF
ncbi:MAG: metalloprotease [Candidatus Thermoplasmatota archaeon]|nr:metalloprotease [Candidatus Thermoplasmatota archaeon]MCL6089697.1 metalloprotease [Candidatus Thermoplasmatota archaeon]MDA8143243.1 metalloprotease [Thermoplasmatales archaeon]